MSTSSKIIYLKKGKDEALLRGHLWVFSGAISYLEGDIADGDLIRVFNARKEFLAWGHFNKGSISVRIISRQEQEPDQDFWNKKIETALALRKSVGFWDNKATNAFRLIHAEGDGLPGLIIDFYNGVAVFQAHSLGMLYARTMIAEALKTILGKRLISIYDKSTLKNTPIPTHTYIWGKEGSGEMLEYSAKFKVDWESGQKTGFFLDQRENRQLLGQFSKGKRVLNMFCYSGGFSIYALKAGAEYVESVDVSQKAIDLTNENIRLNFGETQAHRSVCADVIDYLKDIDSNFDVIILDPPAFAKHLNARHNAVQAYKRINVMALKKIKPGGILFTFSCSQVVDRELFLHTLVSASIESGRTVKLLHYLAQPPDHPVNIYHRESEYLKGLVLYVE
jgi:23S rRNA (cytosine1962-C5)-methyltransferase